MDFFLPKNESGQGDVHFLNATPYSAEVASSAVIDENSCIIDMSLNSFHFVAHKQIMRAMRFFDCRIRQPKALIPNYTYLLSLSE